MAGNENSGGLRPTAPQNNTGVSATGGAGSKDGQPKMYIPDMKSLGSTGVETMAQQGGAKLAKAEGTPALDFGAIRTLLDDTQNPMEPQSTGVNFGRGAGESVLPASLRSDERLIENKAIINKYGSALLAAGQDPDAPDSYKQFLNYIIKEMQ